MPTDVLRILELALVAVVYLFFFRVLRAVWAELRAPRPALRVAAPTTAVTTAPHSATPPPAPVPRVPSTLRVLAPPDLAGTRVALRGAMDVGRASTNGVVLNDPTVSAVHARLTHTGTAVLLEDLGSRNGTTLAGRRITGPLPLAVGAQVAFGGVVTVLE